MCTYVLFPVSFDCWKILFSFPESLRIHPSLVFLMRQAERPTKLGGVVIDKGTRIVIPNFSLQMDPKYFPDPEVFDPDRFHEDTPRNKFAHLPFSDGPRVCAGEWVLTVWTARLCRLQRSFPRSYSWSRYSSVQIFQTYLLGLDQALSSIAREGCIKLRGWMGLSENSQLCPNIAFGKIPASFFLVLVCLFCFCRFSLSRFNLQTKPHLSGASFHLLWITYCKPGKNWFKKSHVFLIIVFSYNYFINIIYCFSNDRVI